MLVVTDEGFAKRSAVSQYRLQGRNGFGVKALQLAEGRGALVGALIVAEDDQVMAIMKSGKVIRSDVAEVKRTGRNTQGVTLAKPDKGDEIISIALNAEKDGAEKDEADEPKASEKANDSADSVDSVDSAESAEATSQSTGAAETSAGAQSVNDSNDNPDGE